MVWNISLGYPIGIIGILGLVMILAAWIPQTIVTIKTKKVEMRREFIFLYLFGSFFLILHAILLEDFAFLMLNAGATLVASINLYYSIAYPGSVSKSIPKRGRKGY